MKTINRDPEKAVQSYAKWWIETIPKYHPKMINNKFTRAETVVKEILAEYAEQHEEHIKKQQGTRGYFDTAMRCMWQDGWLPGRFNEIWGIRS